MRPSPRSPPLDFALLRQSAGSDVPRNRRALWWMLGLLVLVLASVVSLVLYLNAFEDEEEARRRIADGQWLEQSVRFHFNRLEEDMLVLARNTLISAKGHRVPPVFAGQLAQGGLLWNEPGAVLWHGWQDPRTTPTEDAPETLWRKDFRTHPANAEALSSMLDIATGLRRSAYGGPMRRADGSVTDVVWLAVPFFERGAFAGTYVAALAMDKCVQGLVPVWFRQNHSVQLLNDSTVAAPDQDDAGLLQAYLAPMGLPGTDLFIEVATLDTRPAMVPRIFLLVALLFLSGMLISLLALRRDIGKRQQVQALLQAQIALRTAMENSVTIGLRAWASDGRILYVNEAFCRMVGYSAAELLGRKAPLPYWPEDHAIALGTVHKDIIAQGTHSDGIEVQFQHSSGRRVDVLIHEAPLVTATGEHVGWMSSVLDISERKAALRMAAAQQERLESSGRLVAMGEVASTLAHELNQPLGALSSFAHGLLNRLRRQNISPEEIERVVDRMAGLSDKAGGVIQRVNAFARQRELAREPINMVEFVRRCVTTQEPRRTGRDSIRLPDPQDVAVWVEADELLLEHVITNLVANASAWARHSESGERHIRIGVAADAAQSMAAISVADNGPGVPEKDREQIFSAFFSTKDDGMGMGLAICRSIVEAHHGRIEVSRDSLLGGARFTVLLPLASGLSDALAGVHTP
ncbi:MAG: PAS domain S-box protein [Gammaproteobacteria bacterium]|nr:PAS domain S-box protein [Gammaproteobacteria bacterium]MBU1507553.1 PAS domain S-box protein [Gammaproteobacteria bacterium]MBU2119278.1 PAS domain S-box protein [Gammaproteobacteria bacterium]MBU2172450.1 PAS domain S-box protein [Gammaproteobacteria bacterium]MBU2200147.1 PAS domain S-box protein [Gammaproteobacteria bacterium]